MPAALIATSHILEAVWALNQLHGLEYAKLSPGHLYFKAYSAQFSKEYLGPQPVFSITSGLRSARLHFGETLFSSVNTAVVILSLSYVFLYLCFKGLYVLL